MSNVSHASLTGIELHESKGVATAAANTLYVADGVGSGTWRALTSADILSSGATAGAPVLLSTLTASASTDLQDTTSFTSAYKHYRIQLENLIPSASSSVPRFQPFINGVFQNTCAYTGFKQSSANAGQNNASSSITIDAVPAANGGYSGTILPFGVLSSTVPTICRIDGVFYNGTNAVVEMGSLVCTASNLPMTGFKFLYPIGTITSGVIKVYGWN
jgi:hypothetical protein